MRARVSTVDEAEVLEDCYPCGVVRFRNPTAGRGRIQESHPSNLESRTADQRIESRIPSAMLKRGSQPSAARALSVRV